jgi:Tfp pilus assembly protein FimT
MTGTLEGCKKMTSRSHFRARADEGNMRTSRFTLLETVAVLAILTVVLGLALPAIGRIPVFLTLEGAAHPVQALLQDAGIRSLHQGKTVTVRVTKDVEADSLTFTIADGGPGGIYSPPQAGPVTVEAPVAVSFPDLEGTEQDVIYRFHPDGGASGPEMRLSLRGRVLILGVSPLTGLVYRREGEE